MGDSTQDFAKRNDRFHGFQDLIQNRVQDVLLASTRYDYFILSQDGRLNEQVLGEYLELNLRRTPNIKPVFSGKQALKLAHAARRYNLIIATAELGDMNVLQLVDALRREHIDTPVILLAHNRHELNLFAHKDDSSKLERTFLWQGDVRILLAIVKYMEDKINVDHDTGIMGVPAIILIEDSIRYYSSFLPVIYTELVKHSQSLLPEGLNLTDKLMRIRARPKILLCDHYEEAWAYFSRYSENVLGIISDVQFPRNSQRCSDAGLQFSRAVRKIRPDVPIMLQSNQKENLSLAVSVNASFLLKGSPLLLNHVREFMAQSLQIGDFIFRLPNGTELGRASDLKSLEHMLERVPTESLVYHGERNDFSTWLKARTEFDLASKLRSQKVSDYESQEELRKSVIQAIAEHRRERNRGQVVDFDRNTFDASASFYRIGGGSLGGKARGLAFINHLLNEYHIERRFPDVQVFVPSSVVLGTDVFDRFMSENKLEDFAIQCEQDDEIEALFQAGTFSRELHKDLRVFLDRIRYPLAVRSSSLLEDSLHHPFAGVYETFMLPNNDPKLETRLAQLLEAVKRVYASTFSSRAKKYLSATQHRLEEEKMAVIVQRVVGSAHGERFYPNLSGTARSFNFYPSAPANKKDGVASVALGLGKAVEEGRPCIRFSPKYPRLMSISVPSILQTSQRNFYAIKTSDSKRFTPQIFDLEAARDDGTLSVVASTYSTENNALYDGISRPGVPIITFAPLLKHGLFPLAEILQFLLSISTEGTRAHVELEFAANIDTKHKRGREFCFLQLRPLILSQETNEVEILDDDRESCFCYSEHVFGNGRISDIKDLVLVDYQHFERKDSRITADIVGRMNNRLLSEDRPFILIGVGRWGSSEPYLGIPVHWSQIAGAKVIVEAGFRDFVVTPSQGTHFFQNIISNNIGYLTVNSQNKDGNIDWEWLAKQTPYAQEGTVRHLRFDSTLTVKMDGRNNEGLLLKPV